MSEAKIRLSEKEMQLVTNADIILTKNEILQKVFQLLGFLQKKQTQFLKENASHFLLEKMSISPKISKGENYKGLPYLILDHPRIFEKKDIFAIRSMFWWGNFFSITLHLSGKYKEQFAGKIISSFKILQKHKYYYCNNEDAWQHHFDTGNYELIDRLKDSDIEKNVLNKPFLKISKKIALTQWETADEILFSYFKQLIEILAD